MTSESFNQPDSKAANTALSTGIASVILTVIFLTPWGGEFILYGSIILGIIAVVFGILALKRRQPRGIAVTGLVLGALSAIFGIALFTFALIFIGALLA